MVSSIIFAITIFLSYLYSKRSKKKISGIHDEAFNNIGANNSCCVIIRNCCNKHMPNWLMNISVWVFRFLLHLVSHARKCCYFFIYEKKIWRYVKRNVDNFINTKYWLIRLLNCSWTKLFIRFCLKYGNSLTSPSIINLLITNCSIDCKCMSKKQGQNFAH